MTHKLPPDPAPFSALLAAPRRSRLAVCLRGTTALSPSPFLLAEMVIGLVTGIFPPSSFPEVVLAPGRRWPFPSGAAAAPAPCGEATPHVQRSPAGGGRGIVEAGTAGALQEPATIPLAMRQRPAVAVAPAEPGGTGPARATATPHAQRSAASVATARTPPTVSRTAPLTATPHAQRSPARPKSINASLRPTPPPGLGPLRGPGPQGEGEYSPARQHPMPSGSRGRLKNGAPGGDYLAAPRCGARTRAGGSCQQPAMPNGRCRLHGGMSTGARTEAGRERLRSIHTRHGGYGRDTLAWFRRMDSFIAETKQVMAESRRTRAVAAAVPPDAGDPP